MKHFRKIDDVVILNMSPAERFEFLIKVIKDYNELLDQHDEIFAKLFGAVLEIETKGGNKQ